MSNLLISATTIHGCLRAKHEYIQHCQLEVQTECKQNNYGLSLAISKVVISPTMPSRKNAGPFLLGPGDHCWALGGWDSWCLDHLDLKTAACPAWLVRRICAQKTALNVPGHTRTLVEGGNKNHSVSISGIFPYFSHPNNQIRDIIHQHSNVK